MQSNDTNRRSAQKPQRVARLWSFLGSTSAHKAAAATVLAYRAWMLLAIGRHSKLSGDETFYWRNAREVLHLLRIQSIPERSVADAMERIVATGWFLPGMSVLTAPARLFSENYVVARSWVAIVGFSLLVYASLRLREMFSGQVAALFLLVVGLLPYTAWFSMTLWGGSIGGLLMLLNLLWVVRMACRLRGGETISGWVFLALGGSIGFNVLVRPAALVQVLPVGLLVIFASCQSSTLRAGLRKAFRYGLTLIAGIVIVLAPWQAALMNELGGPFFLVSSTPMNSILRYGDDAELGEVGDSFLRLGRYLTALADERDESLYSVAMAEHDRIVSDVTLSDRLVLIPVSMHRYFDEENFFLGRALDQIDGSDQSDLALWNGLLVVNSIWWLTLAVWAIHAFVRRWSLWAADGMLGIVMRASFVAMLYQPITRASHGRHINYLIPAFVVFAALASESAGDTSQLVGDSSRWPKYQRAISTAFSLVVVATMAVFLLA